MQSKTLLLIRHGETDWNRDGRVQGHSDIPLNDTGRDQCRSLQLQLTDLNDFELWSSDLSRARETARLIAPQKPLHTSRELREVFLGEAEGNTIATSEATYGAEHWERWRSLEEKDWDITFPGGESRRQALHRLLRFFQQHPGKNLLVVTHGLLMRTLLAHATNADYARAHPIPNCHQLYFLNTDPVRYLR